MEIGHQMNDLILQLAQSEMRLGFAFVQAGLACVALREAARIEEACQRAEASYLRARKSILDLNDDTKRSAMNQLEALRTEIDRLADQAVGHVSTLQPVRKQANFLAGIAVAAHY